LAVGTRRYTMRLSTTLFERIESEAMIVGTTPADFIRQAVEHYISGKTALSASQIRQLRINEYSQVALDTIISEQFPDFRDRIIATTDRRMKQYHGQG
jgi:predicted DNA-binding protein